MIGDDVRQPVSGPMSREVADWYVGYTHRQFGGYERDGDWYLHVPEEAAPGDRPADLGTG